MPSAFRLNFTQPRPSPSSEEPDNPLSLSSAIANLSSPTITSNSETISIEQNSNQPNTAIADEPKDLQTPTERKSTISLLGLTPDEQQFALEERSQWSGDLQRTEDFNNLLRSLSVTFRVGEEDRRKKLCLLLDAQELEASKSSKERQRSFVQEQDRISLLAEESQSQREDERVSHEEIRETIMKEGRVARTRAKDGATDDLVNLSAESRENRQEDFEKEERRMQVVIADLLLKAEKKLQALATASKDMPPQEQAGNEDPLLGGPTLVAMPPGFIPRSRSSSRSSRSRRRRRSRSRSPPTVIVGPPRSWAPSRSPSRIGHPTSAEDTPYFDHELDQRDYDWVHAERARDAAEDERHELFNSALERFSATFSASFSEFSNRFDTTEAARNGEDLAQEEEINTSLGLITSTFEVFKTRIEKRFEVLDAMEVSHDEGLKHTVREIADHEESSLGASRRKRWRTFDHLLEERRASLQTSFAELIKLKVLKAVEPLIPGEFGPVIPPFHHPIIPRPVSPPFMPIPPQPVVIPVQQPFPMYPPIQVVPGSPMRRPHSRPTPIPLPPHIYEDDEKASSGPRTPSPPTGFSPQELLKVRKLSSLPIPRLGRRTKNVSSNSNQHRQKLSRAERAALLEDGLIKRRFAFAINETKRQIKFEQLQAERKRLFEDAESGRGDKFEQIQAGYRQKFLEGEKRRKEVFREKTKQRREKFTKEQERMSKEYIELEARLTKSCLSKEKDRREGMKTWAINLVEEKRKQWERDATREQEEMKGKFERMVQEFTGYLN